MDVLSQFKKWGGMQTSGGSVGVEVTWKVVPLEEGWTVQEAKMIFLDVRRQQHACLAIDESVQGGSVKFDAEAIEKYDIILKVKNEIGESGCG